MTSPICQAPSIHKYKIVYIKIKLQDALSVFTSELSDTGELVINFVILASETRGTKRIETIYISDDYFGYAPIFSCSVFLLKLRVSRSQTTF